ncbi:NADPH oxidase regulator NoxR [Ceratobasidium theobromae]|uniref:NADPH oxidase regulator NoxR n=1 Tax=Ceratobasidium theobromae TaxID=1582974 RepID=A0A5N5QDH1_9AGAM|nr:NADPH oxidase regulator NoxR [Ceratobasidium theobromae]
MTLSLKAELEAWASALTAYDAEDFQKALELFEVSTLLIGVIRASGADYYLRLGLPIIQPISDTSRISTNIGLILATVGEHGRAIEYFSRATELDSYLAIAYFQCGVSYFLLGNFEGAFQQFESALMWLRGNQAINYEQIGLNFRLYTAEVLFNRGLCLLNMGRDEEGMQDLRTALAEKVTPEHGVIDDAIKERGEGYTVFSIPVGVLFRPNPNKVKNLQAKDYLGKARLISKDGSKYETFDGVDPDQLAFRPDRFISDPGTRPGQSGAGAANLGRSSSDTGGTSAPRGAGALGRSVTTVARSPSRSDPQSRPDQSPLMRSATSVRPLRSQSPLQFSSKPLPAETGFAPTRGLSVRRTPGTLKQLPEMARTRLTELYESYLGRPAPTPGNINEWVESTTPGAPLSRAPSRAASVARSRAGNLSRSQSQAMVRRAPSSKGTMQSRRTLSYDEEEGYASGSGDFDDIMFETSKIQVRLHFKKDLRGMAITPNTSCDEFMDRVCAKFGRDYGDLSLKFSDEDGAKVTIIDDSDFELAIEVARAALSKGKDFRLEIWCEEVNA